MNEKLNDRRVLRFKAHGTEADWLTEGGKESDWARVMSTK